MFFHQISQVQTHVIIQDAVYTFTPDSILLCVQKGSQHICVESPGLHELHFVDSCIFFGSSSMKIDTSNPLVHLKKKKKII